MRVVSLLVLGEDIPSARSSPRCHAHNNRILLLSAKSIPQSGNALVKNVAAAEILTPGLIERPRRGMHCWVFYVNHLNM